MNFAAASSHAAKRAIARGVYAHALAAVVVMTMQGAVVAPPRSPGPGRP